MIDDHWQSRKATEVCRGMWETVAGDSMNFSILGGRVSARNGNSGWDEPSSHVQIFRGAIQPMTVAFGRGLFYR